MTVSKLSENVALCVTLVSSGHWPRLKVAIGVDALAQPIDRDDAIDTPAVAVVAVDGGVVLVELNGDQGVRPTVLEALSQQSRVASLYWSANGRVTAGLADAGSVLVRFDYEAPHQRTGSSPSLLDTLHEGITSEIARDGRWVEDGLALIERFTRISTLALDVEDLDEFWPLIPIDDDGAAALRKHLVRDEGWRAWAQSQVDDEQIFEQLMMATPDQQRGFAYKIAGDALERSGLGELLNPASQPNLAIEDLKSLTADQRQVLRAAAAESTRAARLDPAGLDPATRLAWSRGHAATAVQAAAYQDPDEAAVEAASSARLAASALGHDDWPEFARSQLGVGNP